MFEVFWGFGSGTELERGVSQRNRLFLMILSIFPEYAVGHSLAIAVLVFAHLAMYELTHTCVFT